MGRRKLVVGNWKLNGDLSLVTAMKEAFQAGQFSRVDTVVCPPFPYLTGFIGSALQTGAQDVSAHASGAYTGEVSARQLRECSCRFVIVGHSERREYHAETDTVVAEKAAAAISAGLIPIVCVGESLEIRESGSCLDYVSGQVEHVIDALGENAEKIVLAYEPVWAIGTGKTATPEQAQEVHERIRLVLAKRDTVLAQNLQILYGGSVKAENAGQLFSMPDIDGGLIGGASLKPDDFMAICTAAENVSID